MKQHLLSALAIVAMLLLGSATSFIDEIHADIQRTPDGLMVTNLDDFAWKNTRLLLRADEPSSPNEYQWLRAGLGTIDPGDVRVIAYSEIKHETGSSFSVEAYFNVRVYIECMAERGSGSLVGGPPLLGDLPFTE